jgi:hypothetical protein
MTFAEDAAAMTEELYAEFSETVTYKPVGAEAKSANAIIEYGKGDEYKGADSYGVRAIMRVCLSEIAQPGRKDEVTIGTDIWVVIGADRSSDGLEWIVEINKITT